MIDNVYIKLKEYCRSAHGIEFQVSTRLRSLNHFHSYSSTSASLAALYACTCIKKISCQPVHLHSTADLYVSTSPLEFHAITAISNYFYLFLVICVFAKMMSFWFAYLHVQGADTLHHYSLIKIMTGMISIFISCLSLWLSELVNCVLNTWASMVFL